MRLKCFMLYLCRGENSGISLALQSITGPTAASLRLSRAAVCLTSQAQIKQKGNCEQRETLGVMGKSQAGQLDTWPSQSCPH